MYIYNSSLFLYNCNFNHRVIICHAILLFKNDNSTVCLHIRILQCRTLLVSSLQTARIPGKLTTRIHTYVKCIALLQNQVSVLDFPLDWDCYIVFKILDAYT